MTPAEGRVRGVYETVLYAADVAAAARFYAGVLGLQTVRPADELSAVLRLADGAVLLLFDPARSSAPGRFVPSHGAVGAGHVAFAVDSLEAWERRLCGAEVEIERAIDWDEGGRSLYVRDPAGNSVELVEGEIWPGVDRHTG